MRLGGKAIEICHDVGMGGGHRTLAKMLLPRAGVWPPSLGVTNQLPLREVHGGSGRFCYSQGLGPGKFPRRHARDGGKWVV